MRLKNIIGTCAEILGLQDVTELVNKPDVTAEDLTKNSSFQLLRRCANLVLSNIAGNYVECVTRQLIATVTNRIDFTKFDHEVIKIIGVKKDGMDIGYELFVDHLRVQNGYLDVEYSYMPRFKNADSEISVNGISEDCLVYGTLAEYGFISGMFNEAKIWNEKFERFLFGMSKREIVIPAEKW